jgi:predicted dehydrogenase
MKRKTIRYGMVGGSLNAFIGGVHRNAINFEACAVLVAGCFSTNTELNKETGEVFRLDSHRVYSNYKEMAEKESQREDGIDFVCIVTPNHSHYEIAKEFILNGINIVCEKPLCFEVGQAKELKNLAEEKGVLFAVTYAYSGYPMVKFAKQLVDDGKIGKVINVSAEYPQEWLIDELSDVVSRTSKLSGWRTDPKVAGISNCVGDIGSHIENTVAYITGLKIKRVAARVDRFGHELDLNANMLVEYDNGSCGNYWCSQVAVGNMNGLTVRIYGTLGAIEWDQEKPEYMTFTPKGEAPQILARGNQYIYGRAAELKRIPCGHPEGYYEAFANLYKTYIAAVLKKINGEELTANDLDFPKVDDGLEGVKFIHAVIESGDNDAQWVNL